ncbi:MAG: peptidylprolyl isomerase [Zetaproteobacteria bacterium CG_4_9_14_3_um_filter_49_83]|nr:MAG: peptidylprolyl isomerase [Zetaproteobacteria bacterium CG1_02_49_23]PIQ30464.1 MAG: peptidylprolyl isomerase [Zetaproteobacteria bacterium CG17_big_fil_post_rev_8_21_14_2_50_50_13]PIV30082.1 MAG: peptidylprolyl isomerase [Zetaproteobacteria bacterium CG02_land_8_20_14_3_00_50_9]PIY55246.1 MAG: peptidylprolyl isomerase [Zetaproteobacteria bacterium CG_4_10_14_0_8_um_filter_49_80]PJA36058.1 MAG: peptidylprolyl isomerase [Zetaproteobacteria bacterium CG_4_9_14_3_um_filter_49_83]
MRSAMARHILVKTKAEAEKLKAQLDQGADFAKLARKFSTCPSRKRDGDLGEIYPGQLVKAIEDVVFKKPLLKLHGPIKSRFGYHLVVVYFRS